MGKQIIGYMGGLIALYLIVANGSNFGTALNAGANGTEGVIKSLQGR